VRIAALSVAMALNLMILLAALRPLAPRLMTLSLPTPVPTLRLIPKEPPPPPAPPMLEIKPLPATPAPTPVTRGKPAPVTSPAVTVIDEGNVAAPPVTTPTLAPPRAPAAVAAPIEASLGYRRAPLRFPPLALRQRMEGTVLLRVLVDERGQPVDVVVEQSSGYPLLDRSARSQVLEGWMFQPAVVGGRAVKAWARVPVTFQLRGS
jgi:protein TonB